MSKKIILVGAVAAAVMNTVSALPTPDKTVFEKQVQAEVISSVVGNMVQTINSPECTVHI